MHGCYWENIFGWDDWWIKMLLFTLALVFLVCLALRLLRQKRNNFDRRDSLEILKRRLASGEISLEEFETIKKVL